jgi:hypothetical protein
MRHLDPARHPHAQFWQGDLWLVEIWEAPFDLVLPDLVAWAEAGAPEAMEALGSRLLRCTESGRARAQRDYEVRLQHEEAGERISREQGFAPREPSVRAFLVETYAAELRACDNASRDLLQDPLRWIERAGELGYAPARLTYLREAFEEFDRPRSALAGLDQVIERQRIARRFLDAELAAGNQQALQLAGHDSMTTRQLGLPAWERVAFRQVWLSEVRRQGDRASYANNLLSGLEFERAALSAADRQRADAAAAEIAARWAAAVAARSAPVPGKPQ